MPRSASKFIILGHDNFQVFNDLAEFLENALGFLIWDQNCLKFYKNNKTPIKTASIVQARKPIYKTSLRLSDKYLKYFEDSFKQLNNF